jgi:hydroxymethylpyrimidine/phosphomethylpyrimidine kinase
VPSTTPSVTLLFGLFDPSGQQDLPADAITCAAHDSHGVCVLTGVALADTTGLLNVDAAVAESVDDQARGLLEDMPIHAIKVGTVPTPEIASMIAGIAADYSHAPLVLHLPASQAPTDSDDEDQDTEPSVGAVLELILPQTKVVVMGANAIERWLNDEVLAHLEGNGGPQAILALGADWVLVTAFAQRPGQLINLLLGPDGETVAWPWQPVGARVQDLNGLIATAIANHLATGLSVTEAAKQACTYASLTATCAFQAGMGQRLVSRLPPKAPTTP